MRACESEDLPVAPGTLCSARVASWIGRMVVGMQTRCRADGAIHRL